MPPPNYLPPGDPPCPPRDPPAPQGDPPAHIFYLASSTHKLSCKSNQIGDMRGHNMNGHDMSCPYMIILIYP